MHTAPPVFTSADYSAIPYYVCALIINNHYDCYASAITRSVRRVSSKRTIAAFTLRSPKSPLRPCRQSLYPRPVALGVGLGIYPGLQVGRSVK